MTIAWSGHTGTRDFDPGRSQNLTKWTVDRLVTSGAASENASVLELGSAPGGLCHLSGSARGPPSLAPAASGIPRLSELRNDFVHWTDRECQQNAQTRARFWDCKVNLRQGYCPLREPSRILVGGHAWRQVSWTVGTCDKRLQGFWISSGMPYVVNSVEEGERS